MSSLPVRNGAVFLALLLIGCDRSTIPAEPEAVTLSDVTISASAWTTKAPMPTARVGMAAGVIKNSAGTPIVYVVGGANATAPPNLRVVEAYNTGTNTWSTKAPLPASLVFPDGIAVLKGKLYFVGGWRFYDGEPSGLLYEYTPGTNKWRTANSNIVTGSGAVGVIGGKFYVLTGSAGYGGVGFLDRYDPATNTWTHLPDAPHGHFDPAAGVIGGKFYVATGIEDCCGTFSTALDVYDPALGTWETKAPIPTPRRYPASVVLKGKLYVIGGIDSLPTALATVEVYDPATDTWSAGIPMPNPRWGASAVAVTNSAGKALAYVFGGGNPYYGGTTYKQTWLYDPTVPNKPPVAKANGPYTGTVGQPVQFSSAGSFDPEGAWNGTWTFGDGTSYTGIFGNGASQNPAHAYSAAGSYPVTFTVTDANGATSTSSTSANIQ